MSRPGAIWDAATGGAGDYNNFAFADDGFEKKKLIALLSEL